MIPKNTPIAVKRDTAIKKRINAQKKTTAKKTLRYGKKCREVEVQRVT